MNMNDLMGKLTNFKIKPRDDRLTPIQISNMPIEFRMLYHGASEAEDIHTIWIDEGKVVVELE